MHGTSPGLLASTTFPVQLAGFPRSRVSNILPKVYLVARLGHTLRDVLLPIEPASLAELAHSKPNLLISNSVLCKSETIKTAF